MDPFTQQLILAGLAGGASGAASGLGNPNIEPSSFADRSESGGPGDNFFLQDPVGLIQSASRGATNIGQGFADLVSRPVSLPSAFAQPLPTFIGRSLPMPIGVSGADPALFDPSLLSIPGVSVGENPFQEDPGSGLRGVLEGDPRTFTEGGRGVGAIPGLAEATGAAQLLMEAAQEPIPDISGSMAHPSVGFGSLAEAVELGFLEPTPDGGFRLTGEHPEGVEPSDPRNRVPPGGFGPDPRDRNRRPPGVGTPIPPGSGVRRR